MAGKLLSFCLLLLALHLSQTIRHKCLKFGRSCDSCIQEDSECAWCTDPSANIHCHTVMNLKKQGCSDEYIYNPQSRVEVVKNESSPDSTVTLFVQPQEVSLHLRPGVSQSFSLILSKPTKQAASDLAMDTSYIPEGVNITFSSTTQGASLLVQVSVEALSGLSGLDCSNQNQTGPWSVLITPRGFPQSVKLNIAVLCHCDCSKERSVNSNVCNNRGDLVCGRCFCHWPYYGKKCEVDPEESEDESTCKSSLNSPVCSGHGVCVKGYCECNKRKDPKEVYSGRFCECSNFDCPHFEGRPCGSKGKCVCGRCVCQPQWVGEDCSCSTDTTSCMATNQLLCNGRGECLCGECKCSGIHSGPTCEDCPTCTN